MRGIPSLTLLPFHSLLHSFLRVCVQSCCVGAGAQQHFGCVPAGVCVQTVVALLPLDKLSPLHEQYLLGTHAVVVVMVL